jgi:hypothetical protein
MEILSICAKSLSSVTYLFLGEQFGVIIQLSHKICSVHGSAQILPVSVVPVRSLGASDD